MPSKPRGKAADAADAPAGDTLSPKQTEPVGDPQKAADLVALCKTWIAHLDERIAAASQIESKLAAAAEASASRSTIAADGVAPFESAPPWLWDQLRAVPAEYLRSFNRRGFKGTNIDPVWRQQRLTEIFGPNGIGWGFTLVERWREDAIPLAGDRLGSCVFVRGHLWYRVPGSPEQHRTSDQIGGSELADRMPDESYKMAITDCVGKAAVQLGLGAAVYMGQHDSKYGRPEEPPQSRPAQSRPAQSRPAQQQPQGSGKKIDQGVIDRSIASCADATLEKLKGINTYFRQFRDRMTETQRAALHAAILARKVELSEAGEGAPDA